MNSDEELFEEYLQQYCGGKTSKLITNPVNPGIIYLTLDAGYKLIEGIRLGIGTTLPAPYVGFIDEPTLNACAFRYKDRDFIGINAGTLGVLFDVFNRIMSYPNLFVLVGDPSKETRPEPYYDSIQNFFWINPQDIVAPKDEVRSHHAHMLFVTALEFVIAHEYAHLIRGHVDLNNQYRGETNWFELEANPIYGSKAIRGMLRQTLETDADYFASRMGFLQVLARVKHYAQQDTPAPYIYSSKENAVYSWMFAIYISFRLLNHDPNITNFEARDYPSPIERALFIGAIMTASYRPKDYPENYFGRGLLFTLQEADTVLEWIFHNEAQKQIITPEYIEACKTHSDKLSCMWGEEVRPLVEPFARMSLK